MNTSKPLIIGIHGLRNKPARDTLARWWVQSLAEGFRRNLGGPQTQPEFQLVHWADLMYDLPLTVEGDPEPYAPAAGEGPLPRLRESATSRLKARWKDLLSDTLEKFGGVPGVGGLVNDAIARRTPDLHRYYNDVTCGDAVRARLTDVLRATHEAARPIMLVAHSMGSIIAYDVLCAAAVAMPALRVASLITLGSPLGLRAVKVRARRSERRPRVPECVERWENLADPRDHVAADARLRSDYQRNSRGVRVTDSAVINGYVSPVTGEGNPHKIYGYLRAPEMTAAVADFIRVPS